MTVFAIDPADSGALQLNPNVVDTAVMHLPGESTRRLNPPVRRPWAGTGMQDTGEQPLFPTGAELAVWGDQWGAHAVAPFQDPPDGSPPPLPPIPAPPKPSWNGPAGHYPPIEPPPSGGEPPKPGPKPPVVPGRAEAPTERMTLDVRPKHFHPRHRRPLPLPALLTACFGAGGMGGVSVLATAWVVAQ